MASAESSTTKTTTAPTAASERILVKSFDDAVDFIYDLVTRLAM